MLPAIDFDDDLSPETCKVNDVRANRHLPFEFVAVEAMRA